MSGHLIKIENAYVPDYLIETFNDRSPQTNPEYQRGYTAVFTLKDQFGVKLIDPDKSYISPFDPTLFNFGSLIVSFEFFYKDKK